MHTMTIIHNEDVFIQFLFNSIPLNLLFETKIHDGFCCKILIRKFKMLCINFIA